MTEKLIECVRQHDILFNFHLKNYKDCHKRQEAWEEVSKTVGFTAKQCKDTWTKLRNAYTNALKRRWTKSEQEAKKTPKWKYEDEMAFLLPFTEGKNKTNISNHEVIQMTQQSESTCSSTDLPQTKEIQTVEFETIARNSVECHIGMEDLPNTQFTIQHSPLMDEVAEDSTVIHPPCYLATPQVKRQKKENAMRELIKIMKNNSEIQSQMLPMQQVNVATDEIEMFFLSLARMVKNLPKQQQIQIKMKLSQMVCEAELEACQAQSHISDSMLSTPSTSST